MANTKVAYFLWLFFGWCGLHHLYLGRVGQAFIWFATLGGGCGVGWIRDFWKIPAYVRWCNADKSVQLQHLNRVINKPRASCSYFRLAGMFVMGFLTAAVLCATIPDYHRMYKPNSTGHHIYTVLFIAFMVIGNIVGVMLVANIGELTCSKYYPCYGALVSLGWALGKTFNIAIVTLVTVAFTWFRGLQWKRVNFSEEEKKPRRKKCKNIATYMFACSVWLSLITYGIYFNAKVSIEGGERIPVREAMANFFKSPAWQRTKESLYQLFTIYRHAGWKRAFDDARSLFDFSGEVNAYKTLDLSPGAGHREISKQCRKLKAEFHPDRFKTDDEKDKAQERFIEIQSACAVLTRKAKAQKRAEAKKAETKKAEESKSEETEKKPTEEDNNEKEEETWGSWFAEDEDDWEEETDTAEEGEMDDEL